MPLHKLWSHSQSWVPIKLTYTLTLLLPGEYSIKTRDKSQYIGHGMMTFINKFWVVGRVKQYDVNLPWRPWSVPSKWEVLNNNLASLGPCWWLSSELFWITPYLVFVASYVFFSLLTRMYKQLCSSLDHDLPLLVYRSPEVHPWSSNITLNTTKPVGSPWYKSMSLSQGLTRISLCLLLTTVWYSSQNGFSETLLIPKASLVCTYL